MTVERPAAKKSLAVTLILAIGLSLPGSAAWSQIYSAGVAPGASAAGAQAAAAVTGVQAGVGVVPNLSVNTLGALTPAPILSAPVVSPSALALAAPAANAAVIAAAVTPAVSPAAARAVAAPAPIASAAPAANASVIGRAPLDVLKSAGKSAADVSGVEVVSIGRVFDGSKAAADDIRTAPLNPRGVLPFQPSGLRPALALAPAPAAATATQQRMVRSLYQVASIFAEQYAPLDMKKDRFSLDLKREYDKAKSAILADPNITTRQFQDLLAKLVGSMRDYHVSISFHSTESSKLPFQVGGAEGRYYLTHIDREKLSEEAFPFKMGDEVVAFNGRPTAASVNEIADRMAGNTAQTDLRMAELFLTNRRRARGDNDIPKGQVEVVIRSKGKFYKVTMPWDYTPELLAQDVPARNAGLLEPEGLEGGVIPAAAASTGFFSSVGKAIIAAVHPLVDLFADIRAEASENPFMIGARKSFVPRLGQVLWESKDDAHFHAYIFKAKDGRKMGYIRIAAYDGDNDEVKEFAQVMKKFQVETEGLVIDQVSNPGGSLFYLYALASHLTDKPLATPRHRLIIGEGDAHQSAELLLKMMRDSKKSPEAREKEKAKAKAKKKDKDEQPNAGGYPITAKFMQLMVRSAQFVLQQFNSGKRLTDPIYISGVDDIDPAPKADERYTKPILLLTNALDFSGGDFFPAIMQDNKRVTILGVRTAGAGGIVKPFAVNAFGIDHLSATGSLAQRTNGQPIENLGVTPDIPYELTAKDLRTGFAEYRWNILKALKGMLGPLAPPSAPAPVK